MHKRLLFHTLTLALLCCATSLFAQDKNIDKGREVLAKAMDQTDMAKRSEMIQKATELFQKGGMKRELNLIIGDAFLEKKDYVNASNYYGRCDKAEKAEGLHKLADAYTEDAFNDAKNEAKFLKKAMDFYTKSNASKEGAAGIGDRYYERGVESYPKALEYYFIAEAQEKIEKIAGEYEGSGGENVAKAADVYMKAKTESSYEKAGDLYFANKDFPKAQEAYLAGNSLRGIKKYADWLYAQNRSEEGDALYLRLADKFVDAKKKDQIDDLGDAFLSRGNYTLAGRLYGKSGNIPAQSKSEAYDQLMNLKFDSAKTKLLDVGENDLAKAIDANMKFLKPLQDVAFNFDELIKALPAIDMVTDETTGKQVPDKVGQKILDDYYKTAKGQVADNVIALSNNVTKITNPDLKKLMRQRFLQYKAVGKILDSESFAIRIQKPNITVKDCYLQ